MKTNEKIAELENKIEKALDFCSNANFHVDPDLVIDILEGKKSRRNENDEQKIVEMKEKMEKNMDVDQFDDLVCEDVGRASSYLASLAECIANPDDDEERSCIEDGDYEDIKDCCYALARTVARKLGYSIVGLDEKYLHEIEKDENELEDRDDNKKLDDFI